MATKPFFQQYFKVLAVLELIFLGVLFGLSRIPGKDLLVVPLYVGVALIIPVTWVLVKDERSIDRYYKKKRGKVKV